VLGHIFKLVSPSSIELRLLQNIDVLKIYFCGVSAFIVYGRSPSIIRLGNLDNVCLQCFPHFVVVVCRDCF
jgi:hypothetical protein